MKQLNLLKWLVQLADGKPLLFSITILLIAVSVMGVVIKNRDGKIDNCDLEKKELSRRYELKIDSIIRVNQEEREALNTEVKEILLSNIKDAKAAYEEQKELNQKISTTISKTSRLIKNRSKLKNLR